MSTIALPFILLVIGIATVTSVRKLFSALAKYTAQIRASISDLWVYQLRYTAPSYTY